MSELKPLTRAEVVRIQKGILPMSERRGIRALKTIEVLVEALVAGCKCRCKTHGFGCGGYDPTYWGTRKCKGCIALREFEGTDKS